MIDLFSLRPSKPLYLQFGQLLKTLFWYHLVHVLDWVAERSICTSPPVPQRTANFGNTQSASEAQLGRSSARQCELHSARITAQWRAAPSQSIRHSSDRHRRGSPAQALYLVIVLACTRDNLDFSIALGVYIIFAVRLLLLAHHLPVAGDRQRSGKREAGLR